ncbi:MULTISPECIES: hypothetical protein [unclassified Mesorhizobium]|uniref:hypothetical protein n=1 Tax=unclassified Mesorhizobium TaxID=325217 RepID=UPI000FC9B867|nr:MULTISPECIES: hypothetical protein [unclassified Mesorhizobium]RUV91410.1 hypothetical protein EOA49_31990 [Mesorhizobium sp. M1A.F.Ca.IN.020.04.1.1]RUW00404.1 hypothetical protein EOA53_31620 [Mesorhizobium sp. M1A.F.Ca.IN.020.03.1.1]RWH25991.1 MAG: hypothetical protein EOQ76_18880 [Mesorhizobium sp.]RWH40221.1 MAG: hypothetical protein EOQ79_04240 [Mesorhizobium sp.]TIR60090.1 MAG: hypothetical protein E5X22_11215 [Mesorhizobium sp.]
MKGYTIYSYSLFDNVAHFYFTSLAEATKAAKEELEDEFSPYTDDIEIKRHRTKPVTKEVLIEALNQSIDGWNWSDEVVKVVRRRSIITEISKGEHFDK